MSRRPHGLFRGSEFPRLILLAAIVIIGWPLVLLYARPLADPDPPAKAPLLAENLLNVVPDSGLEFQALIDKTGMTIRDNPAFAILLDRVRTTPAAALAKVSRRDIFFTHVWERPEQYRGVPVHLEGTIAKTLAYGINPVMVPGGRLHEAWFYSDENRKYPYVLIIEEPPKGFPIASELHLRASFDGYFFKLLKYDAGDVPRAAPMFVGRLTLTPMPVAPSPLAGIRRFTQRDGFILVIVLLVGYVALRVIFGVRKALRRNRPVIARSHTLAEGEIAPEALNEWLQSVPTEVDDDDPNPLNEIRD